MKDERITKIYFVDDSDDEHFILNITLKKEKINIDLNMYLSFDDFYEDFQHETKADHLLVVFDLNLPVVNGIQAIKRVRGNRNLRGVVIGICTGSEDPADRRNAIEAGADFFINKPLNKTALMNICSSVEPLSLRETPAGEIQIVRAGLLP